MQQRSRPSRYALAGLAMLVLSLAAACHTVPSPLLPASVSPVRATTLQGRVEFPRTVQLTTGTVVNQATLTLYDATSRALAVGKTDAAGAFSLDPGSAFAPAAGDTFVLEAHKTAGTLGSDVVRLRTIVSWGGSSWNSVSGPTVLLNAATTAVCVLQSLEGPPLQPRDALNAVSGVTITSALPLFKDHGSTVSALVTDLLAADQDPVARIRLVDGRYLALPGAASVVSLARFLGGSFADTMVDASGYLQLAAPKPLPRDASSELAYFQCASMNQDGAGVVATDGTYLYVKAWSTYANTTADAHVYKRIGTGYNGTTRGQNYGTIGPVTPGSITAFYWNGGLYSASGTNPNELCRVDVGTGTMTTILTSATTFERTRGVPGAPNLLTCDGTYVYNLSYGINAVTGTDYNGWTVQVLNPANNFSLVRQFTMDDNSYYADGLFCDGTYLYPIEWISNSGSRIRRYRLSDGVLEYEGHFVQTNGIRDYNASANDPISGTWDPVNRVFWIGNLTNDWVHLLQGGSFHTSGTYTSRPLDSGSGAAQYGRLQWQASVPAGTGLAFKVRSADTLSDLASATWYGPTGTGDWYTSSDTLLNPVHQKQRYLQFQASLTTNDPAQSPKLQSLGVEVLP